MKSWRCNIFAKAGDVIAHTEVVHALPGTDVTLLCTFPKPQSTYIVQAQWSKTDANHLSRIAVHHPILGTHYFEFLEACSNFSQWALHLRNVTISLSGQYECSFATYPYGTKAAKIQLIIKAEEEQHYVKEAQLSQTLEIPCLENATSANLSNYPLKWVVVSLNIISGLNNALKIFPTKITDDGKVFSCHVVYHPERIRKSSTTVRVFGKELPSVCWSSRSLCPSYKMNVIWSCHCCKVTSFGDVIYNCCQRLWL
uniref:Immunoglobulin domain-containing protein n=1 Tax=Anas platyrhynchos TaxID=8839 RepID=A0A8B9T3C3_ANAPL